MKELVSIGTIHTPYRRIEDCPRNVQPEGPLCTLELGREYADGLQGLEGHEYIQVLYWLDRGKRNVLVQPRRETGIQTGTFALRSPHRPNPIGSSVVRLIAVQDNKVLVKGLDCLDGTELLDIKPAKAEERQ